jgi:multicomponent K+:H+ antiporter subunit D
VLLLRAGADSPVLPFLEEWLLFGGMLTIVFGTIGLLASKTLSRLAGHSLLISTGTLLATVGAGERVLAGALFYLVSSTLAVSAFYLLIELVGRSEIDSGGGEVADPVFEDEYRGVLEENGQAEIGVVIPATLAILGGGFLFCALLLAGLPPFSGFIGKVAMIDGLLGLEAAPIPATWTLIILIILSGFATVIAASRAGIDFIWTPDTPRPPLRLAEAMPIVLLLALCLALTVFAGPAMLYFEQTARLAGTSATSATSASIAQRAPERQSLR